MTHPENGQRLNEEISVVEGLTRMFPEEKYSVTKERLSESSVLQLEKIKSPEIGIAGAVVRVGQRYTKKELDAEIGKEFGDDFVVGDTGFKEIWRVPPEYTFEDIYREEMMAIKTLADSTLELNNWKPEEIEALYFAGSPIIPPYYTDKMAKEILLNYGNVIANTTGLGHLVEEGMAFCCFGACNAGGHAVKKLLTESQFKGKKTLLLVYEGLTKQIKGFDKTKADHLSHYFFSDGGVALGVIPDKTLTYLLGELGTEEDRDALRVFESWSLLIDDREGPLVQRKGNTTFVRLAQPPEEMVLCMEGGVTTKRILRYITPSVKRVEEAHRESYPEQKVKFRLPHVASSGVVTGLEHFTGFKLNCMVDDGNSSGATTLINFARHLLFLERGDHVMLASFGAGLWWDISAVKVGPREKEIPKEIGERAEIIVYDCSKNQVSG